MSRLLAQTIVLLVVLLAGNETGQSAERMRERDVWHLVSSREIKFGSIHKSVKHLPNGHSRILSESRTLVDLLGQQQETKGKFECEVDAALGPLSCSFESTARAGTLRATGRAEEGQFVVTLKRDQITFERRIPLDEKPVFSVCTPDLLAATDPQVKTRQFSIIDEETWTLRRATADRLAGKNGLQVWNVEFENSVGSGVWTITAEGVLQEARLRLPTYSLTKAKAEEATHLTHRKYADRELLVFPLKKQIAFPERLKSLTVRLSWKGVSPDGLDLQALHQQVVRQAENNGRYEVDIRLERPGNEVAAAGDTLKSEPENSVWLSSTPFIRPDDPAILKQAREWTADSRTKVEAATRLAHEVSSYLQGGDLIVETLSGPEVLACRKGKCSEYTTLLASLTRAVEMPTRVALGMRLSGGRWVGHMWCEVWVGEWIPIDATVNEVGGSPALLKLTHSETVMGTQKVRWAVADSLQVEVIDFEKDPQTVSDLKTEISQGSYTNADFGCRITAPADGWKLVDKSKPGVVTIQFKVPGEFEHGKPLVHFVAFGLPVAIDPSILINARKARFLASYQEFKVLTDEKFPVGELKGRRFVFRRRTSKKSDRTTKTTEFLWTDGQAGYLLNLIADESVHDDLMGDVTKLLGTFELQKAE